MKGHDLRFTAAEVVALTGIPYQTLNYWVKIGLVTPSISAGRGSGNRREYNSDDVVGINVALKLRRAGVFGTALVRVFEQIRRLGFSSPAKVAIVVTAAGDVVVEAGDGTAFSVHRNPGQLLIQFTIDVRSEARELYELLAEGGSHHAPSTTLKKPVTGEGQRIRTKRRRA